MLTVFIGFGQKLLCLVSRKIPVTGSGYKCKQKINTYVLFCSFFRAPYSDMRLGLLLNNVTSFVPGKSLCQVYTYQNTRIFIKWKHLKYHTERSKYPFHLGVEIFTFQSEVKVTRISKKSLPRVNFTSPTCNMSLTVSSAKHQKICRRLNTVCSH